MTHSQRVTDLEKMERHTSTPDRIEMNLASTPRYGKWHADMGDCVQAEEQGRPRPPDAIHALIALRVAIHRRGAVDRLLQPSDILAALAELDQLEPVTPDAPRMPHIAPQRDESTQDAEMPAMPFLSPVATDAPQAAIPAIPATGRRRVTRKKRLPGSLHYRGR